MSTTKQVTNSLLSGIMAWSVTARSVCASVNTATAGVYAVNATTQDVPTGFPVLASGSYGILLVFEYNQDVAFQLITNHTGSCIMTRTKWGAVWQPWRTINVTGGYNTAPAEL